MTEVTDGASAYEIIDLEETTSICIKGGQVRMIEKIILAIAIAFALSWNIEIEPPRRSVAIELDSHVETPIEHQVPFFSML